MLAPVSFRLHDLPVELKALVVMNVEALAVMSLASKVYFMTARRCLGVALPRLVAHGARGLRHVL